MLTCVVIKVPRLNVKVMALERLDEICRYSQHLKGRVGGEFELIEVSVFTMNKNVDEKIKARKF